MNERGPVGNGFFATPLAIAAAVFCAGIIVQHFIDFHATFWARTTALLLAAWAVLRWRWPVGVWLRVAVLAMLIASLGAWRLGLARHAVRPDHVGFSLSPEGEIVSLRGCVATRPTLSPRDLADFPGAMPSDPSATFVVEAGFLRRGVGAWQPASGLVQVGCTGPTLSVEPGQVVELTGVLFPPIPPGNPGGIDWRRAGRDRRIFAHLSLPSAEAIVTLPRERAAAAGMAARRADWIEAIRMRAHGLLLGEPDPLSSDDRVLLDGLILGRRDEGLARLAQPFVRTGTYYYLAISGLHVAILAGFCWLVLRAFQVGPRKSAGVVLAIVVLYCCMAEARPPILRAGFTVGIMCLGMLLARPSSALNSLGAAALVLLMIAPGDLFDTGFQLSYLVVVGLLLFSQPIYRVMAGMLGVEPHPDRIEPWKRRFPAKNGLVRAALHAVSVATAAWIVSTPLTAYYFSRFHPWSLLASLAMWPVVWLTLWVGFLKMLVSSALPSVGAWLNGPLHTASSALLAVVNWLDRLPGASLTVNRPTVAALLVFYAWLLMWRFRPAWLSRRVLAAGGAVLVLAAMIAGREPHSELRLDVLAAGDGLAQSVETPGGGRLIFDCGSLDNRDTSESVMTPFLTHRRAWFERASLDAAFLSHPHLDHYAGLPGLARRGMMSRMYVSPRPAERSGRPLPAGLDAAIADCGVPLRELSAGTRMQWGQARAELLWPPRWMAGATWQEGNDCSQVWRITFAGRAILLTADVTAMPQSRLVEAHQAGLLNLRADVLVMPHHGQVTPVTDAFVEAVAPNWVIISTRRPGEPVQARCPALLAPGRHVLTTRQHGATCVRVSPAGELSVTWQRADAPCAWADEEP